jgi:hypothetical protein
LSRLKTGSLSLLLEQIPRQVQMGREKDSFPDERNIKFIFPRGINAGR